MSIVRFMVIVGSSSCSVVGVVVKSVIRVIFSVLEGAAPNPRW